MQDSLTDAVQARLADVRKHREAMRDMGAEARPAPPYTLELADLNAIGERHFQKGLTDGFEKGLSEGLVAGRAQGASARYRQDREIVQAIFAVLSERLERAVTRLQAPPDRQDRRTKDALREEATALIDETRGAISVLAVQFAQGSFDEEG